MLELDPLIFRRDPLPHEVEAAEKEIARQNAAIDTLERRIQRLRADILSLEKAQRAHQGDIYYCKGVITLARRLPEELLAKIFEHCVAAGWPRAPAILSHVCSTWRKAAHSPRVWSHVYVNGSNPDVLGRTWYWLSMAKEAPLDVTLLADSHTRNEALSEAMSLVGKKVAQWRTLSVEADMLRQAQLVASRTAAAPQLQELSVTTQVCFDPDLDGEEERLYLRDAFSPERAPQLHCVRLTFNVLPNNLTVPSHISTLHLALKESPGSRALSAASILDVLDALTFLKELTLMVPLYYENPFQGEEDTERIVAITMLEKLVMYGPTNLNGLLVNLCAPTLRHLQLRSLEDKGFRQDPIGPSLLTFVRNSSCPLETLELHDIDLSPEYFAQCFAALPLLRTLYLHESSISDATLRLLAGTPGGYCPRLTHIDLRWCGQLTGKAIVSLVTSRLRDSMSDGIVQLAEPIQEVAVLNCCYVLENDVLDLARMTVCRVCLRDDDYCRKSVPKFLWHISFTPHPQDRANAATTLATGSVFASAI